MNVEQLLTKARDTLTVRRVYGEPIERDGVLVIPAAAISGGGGAGSGVDEKGAQGEGGGFGTAARPVGAYTIKDRSLTWVPAVDVNRLVVVVGVVLVVFLLVRSRIARARARVALERSAD
ncbi:sporulation protein [Prauserella cavernicola]|uniref:Sporulation protein n=1 Tax=Prauserella cavernicola TaxID=2800127 RepID=A0A934QLM8_9PSEU|nr:sporulation protein [Prauserella cavernicola]MBK1783172.1 sporulation protein [Prauserella cavernicola]